ncbi:hypothetical protein QBC36DRAFT_158777, partial [Triangularia setosa]
WKEFWEKRKYASIGLALLPGEVPEEEWNTHWIKDTPQLDPQHEAHRRVPWFQCISHGCQEHHQTKSLNGHWPVRRIKKGDRVPVRKTFARWGHPSQELNDSYLWTQGDTVQITKEQQVIQFWPKNARCCVNSEWGINENNCPSEDCAIHLRAKVHKFHVMKN